MKRKILALALTLCLLATLLPEGIIPARAEDTTYPYAVEGGNIYYVVKSNNTITITGSDETVTRADIPAQIDGMNVMIIDDQAFANRTNLTGVSIASALFIHDSAFEGCSNLTSVTLPQNLKTLGTKAFAACTSLTEITLPDGMREIIGLAFQNCTSLSSINLPDSLTSIGSAFSNCTSLTSVTIPKGVTTLKDNVFGGCSGLVSVTLHDGITSIGRGAFYGCSSLPSITIPNSVTKIGPNAFAGCKSLTSVSLPDGLTAIEQDTFQNCAFTSITLPSGLTTIGKYAFLYCKNLTAISIPDGVTAIDVGAFRGCACLAEVTLSDSLTTIGNDAFDQVPLISVTIPENVASIGNMAFSSCEGLTSVYFCGNAPTMGENVFSLPNMETFSWVNNPNLTIYYIEGKEGWTSPEWYGYPTATWSDHVHQYTATVTPPTCTEKGYTTHTCACGDSYVDAYVDALGHTEVIDPAVAPTCTGTGLTEGMHCSVCGEVLVEQETLEALGHAWDEGVVTVKPTILAEGQKTYTCTRCGETRTESMAKNAFPFVDVEETSYCYTPVAWAVDNGITNGVSATLFAPNKTCTRGQIVTFLWRAKGSPKPTATSNPFTDVKEGTYYYDAVLWAVENGITKGVNPTTFGVNRPCTRGQAVTFLYRAEGSPEVEGECDFTDVKPTDFCYKPILWAGQNGITNGVSETLFAPNRACTRGQIVTFLYRDLA